MSRAGGQAEVASILGRQERRIPNRICRAGVELEVARVGMNQAAAMSPHRTPTTSRLQSTRTRMAPRRNGSVIEVRVHSCQPLTCPLLSTTFFFSSPRRVRATTTSSPVGDRVSLAPSCFLETGCLSTYHFFTCHQARLVNCSLDDLLLMTCSRPTSRGGMPTGSCHLTSSPQGFPPLPLSAGHPCILSCSRPVCPQDPDNTIFGGLSRSVCEQAEYLARLVCDSNYLLLALKYLNQDCNTLLRLPDSVSAHEASKHTQTRLLGMCTTPDAAFFHVCLFVRRGLMVFLISS